MRLNFINDKLLSKLKKFKTKYLLVGTLVAGLAFFPGCGAKKAETTPDLTQSTAYTQTYEEEIPQITLEKTPSREYDNTVVQMTNGENSEFQAYLSQLATPYTYEEFYQIPQALNYANTHPRQTITTHTHSINLNSEGLFDAQTITDAVLKNNEAYLNSDTISGYRKASLNELSTSEINAISEVIAEALNYEIANSPVEINMDELRCVVGNLKMFSSPSTSNAYVNNDDCLVVSPNMLDVVQLMDQDRDAKRDVLIHEAKHLIQKSCEDNLKDNNIQVGVSREYGELSVNPLNWQWFYEASAEETMDNQTGNGPITYQYLVSYLDSISMATILDDNVAANTTEYLCFQKDPEKLFEQFGCDSEAEREELIKMMYTIDVLQNERDDFYAQYNPVYGELASEDELVQLQRDFKVSVCETLTKKFYENLSNYLEQHPTTIDDTFYLIRAFEGDINSHLDCANAEKLDHNQDFMDYYVGVQDNFFQSLADSNGLTIEDVTERFNTYTPTQENAEKLSIDSAKKDFIIERMEEVSDRASASLRATNEAYNSGSYQK